MSYAICSLNVHRSVRGDEKDRDFYAFLNDLVRDEQIAIFAFQEARNINFISGVKKNLRSRSCSPWKGEPVTNSELAFIWNPDRVAEISKAQNPQVFTSYKSDRPMSHEPVCARFVPVDFRLNCEFRLVNIHVRHGGKDIQKNIKEERKVECELAKGVIYQAVDQPSTGKDGSFRSVFTVILGDYNLDCGACNQCGPEMIHTYQEEETTLGKSYCNSYDHFSYHADSTVPRGMPSRIDAVSRYFNGDFTGYGKKVSDHVPIKMELL